MRKTAIIIMIIMLTIATQSLKLGYAQAETPALPSLDQQYLIMGKYLTSYDNTIYTYDISTNTIKSIQSGQIQNYKKIAQPISILAYGEDIFLLYSKSIKILNHDSAGFTEKTIYSSDGTSEYDFANFGTTTNAISFSIVYESTNSISIFVQLTSSNHLEIQKLNLTNNENKWTASYNNEVYNSAQLTGDGVENLPKTQINQICVSKTSYGYQIVCADSTALYKIETHPTLTSEKVCDEIINGLIKTQNGYAYITDTKVTTLSTDCVVENNYSQELIEAITEMSGKIYGLKNEPTKIININDNTEYFKNDFTNPDKEKWQTGQNLQFIQTISQTEFKEYPYSYKGEQLEPLTDLIVLCDEQAEFSGYIYATYISEGQNQYGYVKKDDVIIKPITEYNYKVRAMVDTQIYSYPSNIIDDNNSKIAGVSKDSIITIKTDAGKILNGGQQFVYVQLEDGTTGYMSTGTISNIIDKKEQKSNTNATIIRQTILYQNSNGTGAQLTLEKDTRVTISGKLNPKSKYTKVMYQTNEGEQITGYVLTKDLSSDGLTTLQIIGIILLVINGIILILITGFYSYGKRQIKNKPQSDNTN